MDIDLVKYQYHICERVLQRNLDGVDDAAALKEPDSGANCLNWVIGHVAQARAGAIGLLGGTPPDGAAALDVYQAATSEQFTVGMALPLSKLRALMEQLHKTLVSALAETTPELLAAKAPFSPTDNPQETMGSLLAALAFHEAYHCGQTGILRRELGLKGTIRGPGQAPAK